MRIAIGHSIAITSGVGFGRSSGFTPESIAALHTWVRGDDPDRSINTSPDPDQYESIPRRRRDGGDLITDGTFAQGTSGSQPLLDTATFGIPSPSFEDARRLVASVSSGTYALLHNATSNCDLWLRFRTTSLASTQQMLNTFVGGSSAVGIQVMLTSTERFRCVYGNGSATTTIDTDVGAIVADAVHTALVRKREAAITIFIDGTEASSGNITTPSASDPQHAMVMGATVTAAQGFVGQFVEWLITADDTDTAPQVEPYLNRWQVAA